jgi:hypothetical protein
MITGLLIFYVIVGVILVGFAILTHAILTVRPKQESKRQKKRS